MVIKTVQLNNYFVSTLSQDFSFFPLSHCRRDCERIQHELRSLYFCQLQETGTPVLQCEVIWATQISSRLQSKWNTFLFGYFKTLSIYVLPPESNPRPPSLQYIALRLSYSYQGCRQYLYLAIIEWDWVSRIWRIIRIEEGVIHGGE